MNRETYNQIFNEGGEGFNPYAPGCQDTVHNLCRGSNPTSAPKPKAKTFMWNGVARTFAELETELAAIEARLERITDAFAINITTKKRDELAAFINA